MPFLFLFSLSFSLSFSLVFHIPTCFWWRGRELPTKQTSLLKSVRYSLCRCKKERNNHPPPQVRSKHQKSKKKNETLSTNKAEYNERLCLCKHLPCFCFFLDVLNGAAFCAPRISFEALFCAPEVKAVCSVAEAYVLVALQRSIVLPLQHSVRTASMRVDHHLWLPPFHL